MKYLRNAILVIIGIYVLTLGLVYVDVYDSRPIISLFKNIQSDSALEVVDFSVEKKIVLKPNQNLIRIEILIMETCMSTQNILLMPMYLV